jgi:hypothetical protein
MAAQYQFRTDSVTIPQTKEKSGRMTIICDSITYNGDSEIIHLSRVKGIYIKIFNKSDKYCITCFNPHRLKPIDLKPINDHPDNGVLIDAMHFIMAEAITIQNGDAHLLLDEVMSRDCLAFGGSWDGGVLEEKSRTYTDRNVEVKFMVDVHGYRSWCYNPGSITITSYIDIKKKLVTMEDWDSQEFKYLKAIHDIIKLACFTYARKYAK